MTYDEIIKERRELEITLEKLIQDYQDKTGFRVDGVRISNIEIGQINLQRPTQLISRVDVIVQV